MILRQHLEKGMKVILNAIDPQITQLHGKKELAGLAQTICYDEELAKMLGEIFDIIGTYGRLEVRKGDRRELSREYVEGMYWDGGSLSGYDQCRTAGQPGKRLHFDFRPGNRLPRSAHPTSTAGDQTTLSSFCWSRTVYPIKPLAFY